MKQSLLEQLRQERALEREGQPEPLKPAVVTELECEGGCHRVATFPAREHPAKWWCHRCWAER
jgi:hypothetical protein